MKRGATLAALGMLAASLASALADDLPNAVEDYIDRRMGCNYWPTQQPDELISKAAIEKHVQQLKCSSIDRDERALEQRYKGNPVILKAVQDARSATPN